METVPVVVVGGGGQAREVIDIVHALNDVKHTYDLVGLVDADRTTHGTSVAGTKVLGGDEWFETAPREVRYVLAIGSPAVRARLAHDLQRRGYRAATLVHPSVTLGGDVRIGEGTILAAGVRITHSVRIGRHVLINVNATVSHDCVVHDFVNLSPGSHATGNVTIDEGCDVGTNVALTPGVHLGAWSVIGAGACVTRDVRAGHLAVGVPAKEVRRL